MFVGGRRVARNVVALVVYSEERTHLGREGVVTCAQ